MLQRLLLSALLCTMFLLSGYSTERQTVYSLVKQRQTVEWYQEQASLWEKYVKQNPQNGEAWLNYYTATRMLKVYQKGPNQDDLDALVKDMGTSIPESFEYHYAAYQNGGIFKNEDLTKHLMKAVEMQPDNPMLFVHLFTYYELRRDKEYLQSVAERWLASNDMAYGLYAWNYNMLESTEESAILLTAGDNDTYPALVLQYARDVRTDVELLNIHLLANMEYRKRVFTELGIRPFDKAVEDYDSELDYKRAICRHLKKQTERPIYFGVATQPAIYEPFKENMHNTGMALKWSDDRFDNIAVIKKNYEKRFLLDHLRLEANSHISDGVVNHSNANYLVSMLTLYNHYRESEDPKAENMKALITHVAEKANMKDRVVALLEDEPISGTSMVIHHPKEIMQYFVKVDEYLYAGTHEVSNGMYNLFLTDLIKQRKFDQLNRVKMQNVDWRSLLSPEMAALNEAELFQNGAPLEDEFPVCNISKESAELYCKWLTDVYNGMEHKKKQHKLVHFRLPTEKEWEMLASSNGKHGPYPWGGPYLRNAKGCFLANVNTSDAVPPSEHASEKEACPEIANYTNDLDGGIIPVRTGTYMPNAFGLYNMCGNVAEMVKEEGISKGGSWNTPGGHAIISASESFEAPSPEVGFRVVMQVLD